jgi:lysozyme
MMADRLKAMLMRHEGVRLRVYTCPAGKLTIGVGRNLEDRGITEDEALLLLDNDVREIRQVCREAFAWYDALTPARRDVVVMMVFNMGLTRFQQFKNMLRAIERKDYVQAAAEMLTSRWATQVGRRAHELAEIMREGEYAV